MRIWWMVVAIVVGISGPAHAKRVACAPSLASQPILQRDGRQPPSAPIVRSATFDDGAIWVDADFSPMTARVLITFDDGTGAATEIWTTPDRMLVCVRNMPYQDITVSISAISADGNVSSTEATAHRPHERHQHHACGMGGFAVLLLFPIAAIAILVIVWIVSAARRRAKLRQPGTTVPPLVAQAMANQVLDETLFTIAWGSVLALLLFFTDDEVAALLVAYIPITRFARFAVRSRIRSILAQGFAAQLHDDLLVANGVFIQVPLRVVTDSFAHGGAPVARAIKVPRASNVAVDELPPKP